MVKTAVSLRLQRRDQLRDGGTERDHHAGFAGGGGDDAHVLVVQRDPEADAIINDAVSRQPDAAYLLVQRTLLQQQALEAAQARIAAGVRRLADSGLAVILISHNMPQVWDVADRIHIQRLGGRAGVITPQTHDMGEGVAIMTGATKLSEDAP